MRSAEAFWRGTFSLYPFEHVNWGPAVKIQQVRRILFDLYSAGSLGKRILDLGSSDSPVTMPLMHRSGCLTLCVDIGFSEEFSETAKLSPYYFVQGDAENLVPVFSRNDVRQFWQLGENDNTSFLDTAVISDLLNYVDFRLVINNVLASLKPGGRLVVCNMAGVLAQEWLAHPDGVKSNSELLAFLRGQNVMIERLDEARDNIARQVDSVQRQIVVARKL